MNNWKIEVRNPQNEVIHTETITANSIDDAMNIIDSRNEESSERQYNSGYYSGHLYSDDGFKVYLELEGVYA